MSTAANRYHDFSYGHRVVGHENKCKYLHGHNGRMWFVVEAPELDSVGRVMDFSFIKALFCEWLEENWDHRFLVNIDDPMLETLRKLDATVCVVPFNPTAENMARYMVEVIGPRLIAKTEYKNCKLIECTLEETRKCSATYSIRENLMMDRIASMLKEHTG